MMVGMRLQKIMGITVVLALLTAVAAGLSVLNARTSGDSATWVMISRFVEAFLLVGLGLPVARESQLQGSLFVGFGIGHSPYATSSTTVSCPAWSLG